MVSRIFFPIGQGAFYAERHNTFNVVYDCGNWKQTNISKKIVSQSFSKNESVKLLFISHFDWDHISLINTLKATVNSIDYVILPLLHNEQKILMSNIHRILGHTSLTLINDPNSFFGKSTKIIYVAPSENNENNENNENIINIDDEKKNEIKQEIASGTIVKINEKKYSWCFIPFNIKNNERSKIIEDKLRNAGFDVEGLKTNPSYTLKNLTTKEDKNTLKDIYNSLQGKINENSLVVYSGPNKKHTNNDYFTCSHHQNNNGFVHSFIYNKVGCIYTGDVDLNKVDLTKKYSKHWNFVGTVQIPHHGSEKDFNPNFLSENILFCPISFGIDNTYGHPSYKVISNILENNSCAINITEKMDSGYIQLLSSDII
ncbi:hypothetical protein ABRP83_06425 [Pectobacterium brasiliense]|uniref:hypothetical protein n=1 Tax=Pectobacterium brasiliense TaxID=180957 RepID=UPI0032EB5BC7